MQNISREAFEYQNEIRKNPSLAIEPLEEKLKQFEGNVFYQPGATQGIMTSEGPAAIQECIKFLQIQQSVPELIWSDDLAQAAQDHINDCAISGLTGHISRDQSTTRMRIEKYGEWNGKIGESISYGQNTGQEVILQLIIDDGILKRGHRFNLFHPDFKVVGIASGDHKLYKYSTVLDYASEFIKGKPKKIQIQQFDSSISQQAFNYQNQLRQNPKIAIEPLRERLKYFKGNIVLIPGENCGIMTQEGTEVIEENQKQLLPLSWSDGLAHSAQDHIDDCGPTGKVGHMGKDKSTMQQRIERYGDWDESIAENISYGQKSGQDDDGVPSRGHRSNVFNSSLKTVGISTGDHKLYKIFSVFDYAGQYILGKQEDPLQQGDIIN